VNLAEHEKNGTTFVVADVAQAHDGSVGILHSFVDAAAGTGINAIKFQIHIANAESSSQEPFRVKFSYVDATRFDYWKRMELTPEQWSEVKTHCKKANIEFLATPFSNAAVDLLKNLGVERYKIGSGDAWNHLLLEKIAGTGKEVILSTGLGALEELDASVKLFRERKVPHAILQSTTKYPTEAPDIGLGWLATFRERYKCPVGLSDHSGTIYPGLGAVALGASIVEAHIAFDKRMFGPDARASLTVDEFAKLVEGIRFLEKARGNGPDKSLHESKQELRRMFGKALAVNKNLSADHKIRFEDLEGKKPGDCGIPIGEYKSVLGRELAYDKQAWDFLKQDDLK